MEPDRPLDLQVLQWSCYDLLSQREELLSGRFCLLYERRRLLKRKRQLLLDLQAYGEKLAEYQQRFAEYNQDSRIQAGRPLIRKTILLGAGNEQEGAHLRGSIQRARAYRVLLASDSTEVLCLLQNVHIDVLVLDGGLTPLAGLELYNHLQSVKGLEGLPAIIMDTYASPVLQEEPAYHFVELEKPIREEALVRAIDRLLV